MSVKNLNIIISAAQNEENYQNKFSIGIEHAISLLNTDYKYAWEAAKSGKVLYRGTLYTDSLVSIQTPNIRKSQNTHNYFTTIVSELLPSWKNTVKRNKCLLCTSKRSYIDDYGRPYLFLPSNDSRISFGQTDDFWLDIDLQKYGLKHLGEFNNMYFEFLFFSEIFNYMQDLLSKVNLHLNEFNNTNINEPESNKQILYIIKEKLNSFNSEFYRKTRSCQNVANIFNEYKNISEVKEILSNIRELYFMFKSFIDDLYKDYFSKISTEFTYISKMKFDTYIENKKSDSIVFAMIYHLYKDKSEIPFLDKLFDPKTNNIMTYNMKEYSKLDINPDLEYWVDGSCMLILLHDFFEISLEKMYDYYEYIPQNEQEVEFYEFLYKAITRTL